MATTLTRFGWFGLTSGRWSTNGTSNTVVNKVDGIKIPYGLPPGSFPNVILNPIQTGNGFLTLTGDSSSRPGMGGYDYTQYAGISNGGALVAGNGGSKITGAGRTGISNDYGIMLFGNGINEVKGTGKIVVDPKAPSPYSYSFGLTGVENRGIMQFGNGKNTLTGVGFIFIAPPTPNVYNTYPVGGHAAIKNYGSIIFGDGNNTIDALAGGFDGNGYIEFGTGQNQIKGFGQVSVDGGGNAKSKLLLNPGTYQIIANGTGGTYIPFQVSQTGEYSESADQYAQMDITGIPLIGAASSGSTAMLKQGTLTVESNGKLVFETAIGNDAYMVYDPATHTKLYAFVDNAPRPYDQITQRNIYSTHEVRFASTKAGKLTLFAEDTGVGSVTVGTGTGATALTTGTTSLDVDASAVIQGLSMIGNNGNNKLTGGLGDDRFVASLGADAFNGRGGVNTADFSKINSALTIKLKAGTAKTTIGLSINNTLVSIQNVLGGTAADTIIGNQVDNIIAGGLGVDKIDGVNGSDTYVFKSSAEHTAAEIKDSGVNGTDAVLFDSTTAGQTLKLFVGDTGIETVSIGKHVGRYYTWSDGTTGNWKPEDGATGTGTIALNIDAFAVLNGLKITGNDGDNTIKGSKLGNSIFGGDGVDKIIGRGGGDQIDGGLGNDFLIGGIGKDVFVFSSTPNNASNRDTIADFVSGTDSLHFNQYSNNRPRPRPDTGNYDSNLFYIEGLDYGSYDQASRSYGITRAQFLSAPSATQASTVNQRFIYGTTTGILSYDRDGSGSDFGAVQVAVLGNGAVHPALAYTDIRIVQNYG